MKEKNKDSRTTEKRRELLASLTQNERDYISKYGWQLWEQKQKFEEDKKKALEESQKTEEAKINADVLGILEKNIEETQAKFDSANDLYEEALKEIESNPILKVVKTNQTLEEVQSKLEELESQRIEMVESEKRMQAEFAERYKKATEKLNSPRERSKIIHSSDCTYAQVPKPVNAETFRSIYEAINKMITEVSKLKPDENIDFLIKKVPNGVEIVLKNSHFMVYGDAREGMQKMQKALDKIKKEVEKQ